MSVPLVIRRISIVAALIVAVMFGTLAVAQAYTVEGPSKGLIEQHEREAKEAAEKQAQENAEKQAHEAAEKKQKEEQEHQAAEARQREEAQRQEAERKESEKKAAVLCVVPNLKGDSLSKARTALGKAHCALGKVVMPKHSHGRLAVAGQSVKAGLKRPNGTAVGVTLHVARKRR
jgi:sRNA-binding protein